jgi:hypothetical protein
MQVNTLSPSIDSCWSDAANSITLKACDEAAIKENEKRNKFG